MWDVLAVLIPLSLIPYPMKVTQKNLASLPDGRHLIEKGLYVCVRNNGKSRIFVFRYQLNDRRRDMSLGSATPALLPNAKAQATRLRAMIVAGIDPLSERKKQKSNTSKLQTLVDFWENRKEEYFAIRRFRNPASGYNKDRSLRRMIFPTLGSKRIDEISSEDIANAFKPFWNGPSVGVALVARGSLEALFNLAIRDGLIQKNPAVWRGGLETFLPPASRVYSQKHHKALEVSKLKEIFPSLIQAAARNSICSKLIAFIALTTLRFSEAACARWEEIDFDNKIFNVPPERRKDGRPENFRVPLSDQAIEILHALPHDSEFVFPTKIKKKPYENPFVRNKLKLISNDEEATVHGLRSSFRDWAAEQGFPSEIAERCLMHRMGDAVERAYQRSDLLDLRRPLMQKWADELISIEILRNILSDQNA